jgi:anti-anti-sigma factor
MLAAAGRVPPGRDVPLQVDLRWEPDGTACLTLAGELDCCGAPAVCRAMEAAASRGVGPLLVDLSALTFCDAAGLGIFVAAHHRLRKCGRALTLLNPPPRFVRLLAVSHLDYLLEGRQVRR